MTTPKDHLHRYLQVAREAVVWKLDGLSEYDVRRPLVPTGTNLLGLVKHLACCDAAYFGQTFGRPFPEPIRWWDDDAEDNADLWATPDESREEIIGFYGRAWAHSDATIAELDLEDTGRVAWWSPERNTVTLHQILIHMIAETHRHAGHADLVRELIDGGTGLRQDVPNMPRHDTEWWADYRDRVEQAARQAAGMA